MGFQRSNPAALRAAARREQEDAAPRLLSVVPTLKSLALTLEERRRSADGSTGGQSDAGSHIRRVVVEHAPAMFQIPCGNRACQDGGHDLTREILHALRSGQVTFEGDDACNGATVSGQPCELLLRYRAQASFDPSPAD